MAVRDTPKIAYKSSSAQQMHISHDRKRVTSRNRIGRMIDGDDMLEVGDDNGNDDKMRSLSIQKSMPRKRAAENSGINNS